MSYETEKTMLVQLVYSETDKVDKIIPLPDKLIIICDFFKGVSQFILYSDELQDINTEKDLKYVVLSVTNDPYASYAGGVNNLGYFRLLWVIGFGVVSNNNPFAYVTNDLSSLEVRENIPLRHPQKTEGDRGIRFLEEDYNSYQIVEYSFGDNLSEDINIKYSIWDYKQCKGSSIEKDINLMSAYNRTGLNQNKEHNSITDIYQFHNFKKNK